MTPDYIFLSENALSIRKRAFLMIKIRNSFLKEKL
jgi:hypothetical protein